MAKKSAGFVLTVDNSIKLPSKAKANIAAAIGGAAAAEIARFDVPGNIAFIPHIKWPGGRIIDLSKYLSPSQLKEIDPAGSPVISGSGF